MGDGMADIGLPGDAVTGANAGLGPGPMYPTPPGSRGMPSWDLDGAVGANGVRMYPGGGGMCLGRAARDTPGGRSPKAPGHILGRIREPRGGGGRMSAIGRIGKGDASICEKCGPRGVGHD